MSILLTRIVNDKERYYKLNIEFNLFEEYLVENIYGSVKNKTPTGVIQKIFITKKEAINYVKKTIEKKIKKGYKILYKRLEKI
ncbi:WGR domain-containing protein [Aliarcobacter skirrowii]|uniref:WGR domain-containing protein n=1 Tax=Aliarcobacter skirrowii TaxID=28200 RepID=UPI0029B825E6|nr:WGR domain-containing protein [Aliarcobacter skirrowii]MDX4028344.1 WGR domain-containing protein [Aliarcobacter skirrowii]